MLRRLFTSFTIMLACNSANAAFFEKELYTPLAEAYSSDKSIDKFFSLTCNPCWNMSTLFEKNSRLKELEINRIHAVFDDLTETSARLYYTAKVQVDPVPHALLYELFAIVQSTGELKLSDADLLFSDFKLLNTQQLSEDQLVEIESMIHDSINLTESARISAIPAFVVNGKFSVNLSNHRSIDQFIDTLNRLKDA